MDAKGVDVAEAAMLIDGEWVEAAGGATYAGTDPVTEQALVPVPDGSIDDMRRAINAARSAFDTGPWPNLSHAERGVVIDRLADLIERDKEEIAEITVSENGSTGGAATLASAIGILRTYAELCASHRFEEVLPVRPEELYGPPGPVARFTQTTVVRQPIGVCGLIPTWNGPAALTLRKLGPALATGCTSVIKAPPPTPRTILKFAELLDEAGVPAGVVNVVTGTGLDFSEELVASPLVDMVSFTGGVTTGRRIMEIAAPTLKRVALELGGKSAHILLDDADFSQMAAVTAGATYLNAGQVCSMLSRVLVPRGRLDDLLDPLVGILENVRLGDPRDPEVQMGPLISTERRSAVERYVEIAVGDGANLVTGGRRPDRPSVGYFYEPTVLTDVRNDMRVAQEEVFGPVVSIIEYDSVDEAVAIANDSIYGLQARVTGADPEKTAAVARRLRAGAVSVNGAFDSTYAPRGGFKQSGLGREVGKWALEDYTEYQAITAFVTQ